jgi:hypothetical protein
MVESVKEVLQKEINLNFFIQDVSVKVTEDRLGNYYEYNKLYVTIRDAKLDQDEIKHQQLIPENLKIHQILKDIEKLYNVYTYTQNQKLKQGAREEIQKLIALLIWRVGT